MAIEQIEPRTAYERMLAGIAYLDVRTVEEFEAGHPADSHNIPLLFNRGGQMVPNENFVEEVKKKFPPDAALIIGCRTGARSQRACEMLGPEGYASLANVQGSFAGTPAVRGWQALELPVTTGSPEGRGYTGG